jgi:hypothetical protein
MSVLEFRKFFPLTEQQIKDEFNKPEYKKWKITVYSIKSKADQHARIIQGTKYITQIDRGLSVFGKDGHTFETVVNIFLNKKFPRISIKESEARQII